MSESDEVFRNLTKCEDGCLDICERTTYFIPQGSIYWYSQPNLCYKQSKCSITEIAIANFDYPLFKETLKWTFPSFFGVLGGALGLWLGIDVLSIVIYFGNSIIFVKQAFNKKQAVKKAVKTAMKRTEPNNGNREVHGHKSLQRSRYV